jgi:hypothetical protein
LDDGQRGSLFRTVPPVAKIAGVTPITNLFLRWNGVIVTGSEIVDSHASRGNRSATLGTRSIINLNLRGDQGRSPFSGAGALEVHFLAEGWFDRICRHLDGPVSRVTIGPHQKAQSQRNCCFFHPLFSLKLGLGNAIITGVSMVLPNFDIEGERANMMPRRDTEALIDFPAFGKRKVFSRNMKQSSPAIDTASQFMYVATFALINRLFCG